MAVDINVGRNRIHAFLNPTGGQEPDPAIMVARTEARSQINQLGRNDDLNDRVSRQDEFVAEEYTGPTMALQGYGTLVNTYGQTIGTIVAANNAIPVVAGVPAAPLAVLPAAAPTLVPYTKRAVRA